MSYGATSYGFNYGGPTLAPSFSGSLATILNTQRILRDMKSQFIASENLRIVFPPFLDTVNNVFITTGDIATLIVVKPDGSLFTPAPTLVRDVNSDFWTVEIDASDFEIGEWTIKAESDTINTLDQYQSVVWGDYLTDIRQATLGRWRIIGTDLNLYEDDGTTIFRTFNLKDSSGLPTVTQIFERDPV